MPEPLDEAVVETIIRWYVLNGGAPGSLMATFTLGFRRASPGPLNVHASIGLVLAECPYRVPAGNPFQPEATITAVERRVIAEVSYESCCRQAGRLQMWDGRTPSPETLDMMRERDLWHRMEQRYHDHPSWRPAMDWLQAAFARVVHGDPERGLRGDASFLAYIQGA